LGFGFHQDHVGKSEYREVGVRRINSPFHTARSQAAGSASTP
jgi:hypothetical protein